MLCSKYLLHNNLLETYLSRLHLIFNHTVFPLQLFFLWLVWILPLLQFSHPRFDYHSPLARFSSSSACYLLLVSVSYLLFWLMLKILVKHFSTCPKTTLPLHGCTNTASISSFYLGLFPMRSESNGFPNSCTIWTFFPCFHHIWEHCRQNCVFSLQYCLDNCLTLTEVLRKRPYQGLLSQLHQDQPHIC